MNNIPTNILFETSIIADGNMSFRIGNTRNSLQNRERFVTDLNIAVNSYVCMRCDHGEQITTVNRSNVSQTAYGAVTQEDMILSEVLVTQEKGLALMLLTADCLPVSFYDPVTETIALAHFSRETISKMLPQKTICFLREHFAVDPTNLMVTIGPHIHTNSYSFLTAWDNIQEKILPHTKEIDGTTFIDLMSACNQQLFEAGVEMKKITVSEIDTLTSPNHFSHYASRTKNAPEGRLATILMLR